MAAKTPTTGPTMYFIVLSLLLFVNDGVTSVLGLFSSVVDDTCGEMSVLVLSVVTNFGCFVVTGRH